MDLGSSLASFASRKQLRRFAASLGLHADEPGGLVALLALPEARVNTALADSVSAGAGRHALASHIAQMAREGPPSVLVRAAAALAQEERAAAAATATAAAAAAAACPVAAAGCCVECRKRTPYVFELRGRCRLCEGCERRNASKYALLSRSLACAVHALAQADLHPLPHVLRQGGAAGKGKLEPLYLRADVEALAARVHGGAGEVAARQRGAAREWKEKSFSTDARSGKSHKWKEWNTATFQKQQRMRKHHHQAPSPSASQQQQQQSDAMAGCMDLSGLVHVGFEGVGGTAARAPVAPAAPPAAASAARAAIAATAATAATAAAERPPAPPAAAVEGAAAVPALAQRVASASSRLADAEQEATAKRAKAAAAKAKLQLLRERLARGDT
jgi:hypothetical protein